MDKTFISNARKLSWQKFHNDLVCEFTAHYASRNAKINLKSTTTNAFNFQIINSLMQSWGVRLTWLDCNIKKGTIMMNVMVVILFKLP